MLLGGLTPAMAVPQPVNPEVESEAAASANALETEDKADPEAATSHASAGRLVVAAGDFQDEAGCSGDWQPDCEVTALTLDDESGLFYGDFTVPAGTYEYKMTADGGWDTNWGKWGAPGGDNIVFTSDGSPTHFVFNIDTGESVAANSADMVTVPGSFQSQVGCSEDWQPSCLATAMFPQEDGTFGYKTSRLSVGTYEFKVAKGMAWIGQDWGEDGGSANASFTTSEANELVVFSWDPDTKIPTVRTEHAQLPGAGSSQAIWLDANTVAWPFALAGGTAEGAKALNYILVDNANVKITPGDLSQEEINSDLRTRTGYIALRLTDQDGNALERSVIQEILRGPIEFQANEAAAAVDAGSAADALARTGTQIPGVLDDVYGGAAKSEDLGVIWDGATPTLRLWAPTALDVSLNLWKDPAGAVETLDAQWDDASGVWTVVGASDWENAQYLWDVSVYAPSEGDVVNNVVTDPYSKGLTVNSKRSVIVNLDNASWIPEGWGSNVPPALRNQSEQTIYELHVRDFSIWDDTVPEALKGSYKAFTVKGSDGTDHLKELSEAGLTTVHLLPTFDIATTTIPELREDQQEPTVEGVALTSSQLATLETLSAWGPASEIQQAAVAAVANQDGFNWGYDPFHWGTPEGSYATAGNQTGGARSLEYREMVSALHDMDLRVVQDVVFNHTAAHGQAEMSVLDRVVPGYYQRLNAKGIVETSTCCSNIATEHTMAEKIMVDTVVAQAVDYHIDGFRFDLMGHHSLDNMIAVRDALNSLTLAEDGVDGSKIYLYGEGWDFGEVAGGSLFTQATQTNIAGSDIGAFNDRLRDAVHGGGPFDEDQRTNQGFGTGQYTDPNETAAAAFTAEEQEASLLHNMELIMVGLAGSLKDVEIPTQDGVKTGKEIDYNGQQAGYTASPQESINYVEAHDNETLYDMGIFKLPTDSTMDTRVRMQVLSNATVALAQSPAFFASGTELLRSKSLDRDSYNSGDWFNALDWTMNWNGFGKGLPIKEKNEAKWTVMREFLEDDANLPGTDDMSLTNDMTLDLLKLRSSTPLFTLGSEDLIMQKLSFPNAGEDATPGVIVMSIDDRPADAAVRASTDVDANLDGVVVVFNATPETWVEAIDDMAGRDFELSPVQVNGADSVVKQAKWDSETGTATVPARTVAVFVQPASDVPPAPEYKGTIEVAPSVIEAGATLDVSGSGWEPGAVVELSIAGLSVSVPVTVGADGSFTSAIVIPKDAEAGNYSVTASEGDYQVSATFEVKAAASGGGDKPNGEKPDGEKPDGGKPNGGKPGTLPQTGANVFWIMLTAVGALGAGTVLYRAKRKAS